MVIVIGVIASINNRKKFGNKNTVELLIFKKKTPSVQNISSKILYY